MGHWSINDNIRKFSSRTFGGQGIMARDRCEVCVDDGTLCGNKAVQLGICYISRKAFCACRKHSLNGELEGFETIKLNKFVPQEKGD